jgi:O-antigen/teichoic acid export membrane protein
VESHLEAVHKAEGVRGLSFTNTMNTQVGALTDQAGITPKLSHAGLLMASQVAKWSLRLIFVLVLARALGPKELGVYALLFTVVEFLAVASGAGYADYLTREAAKDARVGWGLAFQLVCLRIAIAVPVALIEIGILSLIRYPHTVLVGTAWMALAIIPRSLSEAVQGVLRGVHRYSSYLVIEIVFGGSLVAGAVVLFVRHGRLGMAITVEVLAAMAAGLAGLAFAHEFRTRERIHIKGLDLVKKSAVFNVYSLIGNLYDRFDVVLLSKLAGDYATGIYSVAYRALNMTQVVGYGVLYSLLPALSRNAMRRVEQRRLERALGLLLSVAFFILLATIVFARPAVALVLGPQYADSAKALKILIWSVLFRYANYALNIALLAAGRERVFVATSLTCLAVNLAGNLLLIPRFGWQAAAAMTIVTEVVLLVQNVYWIHRTRSAVVFPGGVARTSLAFGMLLAITLVGGSLGSPLTVGTGCLVFFAAYLVRTGMLNDFAAVWGTERVTAG